MFLRLIAAVVLSSIGTAAAPTAIVLRFDGIGPARIGMTLSQLNSVLNGHFSVPNEPDERDCFYIDTPKLPQVQLMIEKQKLSRVDANGPTVHTERGIGIGDSEARVKQVYGKQLHIEPHAYDDRGHYLTIESPDKKFGIRFETDGQKVTSFYGGTRAAISYIEGCQ